jgi:GNAT superfamily N-acetyltransferase
MTVEGRLLQREEIPTLWSSIDRREVIDAIYYYRDGELVLEAEHYDMSGWPPGEAEVYTPLFEKCFDGGGWLYGLYDGDKLAAIVVLENHFIGKDKDLLQLKFLMVSRDYRGQGLGCQLYDLAAEEARRRGAKGLYVSATPSKNTVTFYRNRGCTLIDDPDPEQYALEPEDIHLEHRFE